MSTAPLLRASSTWLLLRLLRGSHCPKNVVGRCRVGSDQRQKRSDQVRLRGGGKGSGRLDLLGGQGGVPDRMLQPLVCKLHDERA